MSDSLFELDNVDDFLTEIEKKYSSSCVSPKNELEEQLNILSQEFETLGLSVIDISQPQSSILKQITFGAFNLIQIHRKALSGATDLGATCKFKDSVKRDLEKVISNLKTKVNRLDDNNAQLEKTINKITNENTDHKKKIAVHNRESEKIKQYYKSKINQLNHTVNRLQIENQHLKEMCAKDVDKYFSKEDKFMNVLKKHRQNEQVYQSALQKLEDNNAEIMNEILNLKNELALAYLKK